MNKEKRVNLVCDECNKEFEITCDAVNNRKKNNLPNLCKVCMRIYTDNKQKKIYNLICEKCNKKFEMDSYTYNYRKKNNPNICDECNKNKFKEKKLYNFICDNCGKKYILNPDEYGKRKYKFKNKEFPNLCKICMKKSQVKKNEEIFSNLSEEKRRKHSVCSSKGSIDYWDNLTVEEYQEKCKLHAIEFNNNPDNHIPETNAESLVNNDLNKYNIDHICQYYNIIKHKDFDILFPYNNILDTNLINPYRKWDFIIYTKQDNILTDVDGNIHNSKITDSSVKKYNGLIFNLKDSVAFNDSQRYYQTDNMNAYVIKSYDSIINNDTKVLDVKTNKYISYKEFLTMVQLMNYSDKELREIL